MASSPVIWALMMPVILLGGIYSGYFTATEAAAVALAYALLVEIFEHWLEASLPMTEGPQARRPESEGQI